MVVTEKLEEMIVQNGWRDVPSSIVTREGFIVDLTGEIWHLPIPHQHNANIRMNKITNSKLRWALQVYVIHRMETVSTTSGYKSFVDTWRTVLRRQGDFELDNEVDLEKNLVRLMEGMISNARRDHRLYVMYEAIRWYIWCTEHYQELGFCSWYSSELEGMVVGSGPKGEAVRQSHPEEGPLHRVLELPLLVTALREDRSSTFEHVQQRAALALSLAFGRNPANLTYLMETDLVDLTPSGSTRSFVISMPRIKKRQINPREDLVDEYLDVALAHHVVTLIERNCAIDTTVDREGARIQLPKPLFINLNLNNSAVASGQWKYSFNMSSRQITLLVQDFVARHRLKSPVTGLPLCVTSRRLRYTLASNLAAEGISSRELARVLDHTNTQHVQVYFEMGGKIVLHLDKAGAMHLAKYIEVFCGPVISSDSEAESDDMINKQMVFVHENDSSDHTKIGKCRKKKLCHLDPPYSCYLCPKFRPYRHADHEHVLDCLLESRELRMQKYDKSRIGVQLDDVIAAVAKVVMICKREV
jgi:hypothetical protein